MCLRMLVATTIIYWFLLRKNAKEIGQLLIKKLPKDVIASELENLVSLSPQLAELAQARIN